MSVLQHRKGERVYRNGELERIWKESLGPLHGIISALGTAVAQWLRCCATNRKVAGSIPTSVSGFFIDIKIYRSHYGPGIPGVFLGRKGGRCVRRTTYQHPVPLSRNLGTLTSWNPLGPSGPVTGLLYHISVCPERSSPQNS
jgi:hypothetical protein